MPSKVTSKHGFLVFVLWQKAKFLACVIFSINACGSFDQTVSEQNYRGIDWRQPGGQIKRRKVRDGFESQQKFDLDELSLKQTCKKCADRGKQLLKRILKVKVTAAYAKNVLQRSHFPAQTCSQANNIDLEFQI